MISSISKFIKLRVSSSQGNILVYIVMTMVIFGALAVTMVSLFSTSISSSAVQNDSRRATYLSEAGTRYARSELLSGDYSKTTIDRLNDNTEYTVNSAGRFKINIFGPWFEPESNIDFGSTFSDERRNFDIQEGSVPKGYVDQLPTSASGLELVNYDYIDISGASNPNPPPSARAIVTGGTEVVGDPHKLELKLNDDTDGDGFVAGRNETVAFAVKPFSDLNNVSLPVNLLLQPVAAKIFPARNGAIEISRHNFFYDQAIDKTTHVELTNIRPVKNDESLTTISASAANDHVILSPRNRYLISEGHSGEVLFGNDIKYASAISDISFLPPKSKKPDFDFEEEDLERVLRQLETPNNPDLFTIDNDPGDKFITIGAGPGPSFGALWFKDTRSIGGQRNFCSTGECQFGRGIRVFFTFTATGDSGEGFLFSLTNGLENSIDSIGGDIQQSELLGYSGDSLVTNPDEPTFPVFLDGSGKGLQAPKIGFEFDTRVNYSSTFEQNQRYCSGNNLNGNTRNDPLSSDKHAIQYVFWAKDNLSLSCREIGDTAGRATYDDNRHDAVGLGSSNWTKNLSGNTNSDPLIRSSDGTIYIGSAATSLFAFKPDGNEKWTFNDPTGEVYSPVLADGRIYVGSEDNTVYAVDPSSGNLIKSANIFVPVRAKPAVDPSGFVYVTADQFLFKIDFSASPPSFSNINPGVGNATSSPAISSDGNSVYAGFADGRLYARNASNIGERRWESGFIGQVSGTPAVAPDGFIFVSTSNGILKIDPNNGGSLATPFNPGSTPTSSPTLSRDGSTVYAGFSNGRLYALNTSDLTLKWFFPSSGSIGTSVATPEVDGNENIYVGSNNNYVYALFADGSLKWEFDTGGAVNAKPAVDQNGTVYVGSNSSGGRLLAINQFTEPRNYRQNFENPPKPEQEKNLVAFSDPKAVNPYYSSISNTNKWFKDGPWAIRVEVDREPLGGDRANYTLRTWVQQCTDANCTNVRGTFFEDTRIRYNLPAKPPNLVQSFELDSTNNLKFNTFLFGFTSAKRDNSDDQLITIDNFQLSFIRSGDPEITE
jgi:outer membrane protein assembly factor BamB